MQFPFNERKAAQAAAFFIQRHGGSFDYYSLIKLLYLADRTALIECGTPITGDVMVSMPKGPVLSKVKNCLTSERAHECGAIWREIVAPRDDENIVTLVADIPGRDELSDYEIAVLERVDKQYGKMPGGRLWKICHDLPEFEDPNGSSRPILPEILLARAKVPRERIDEFARRAALLMRTAELGGR